jgi:hypothetical protein
MDLKYKIIGIVFAVLFLIYLGYFLAQLGQKDDNKKEHYEDVAVQQPKKAVAIKKEETKADEPSNKSTSSEAKKDNYDQRIRIIDSIEKLNIADKNVKSKLTEVLLTDDIIKDIKDMSDSDLSKFVGMKYEIVKNDMFVSKITAGDGIKELVKTETEKNNKVEKFDLNVLEQANKIIENLDDSKKRIMQLKEAFIQTPVVPTIEKFQSKPMMEGFYQGYDNAKQNKFAQFRQ